MECSSVLSDAEYTEWSGRHGRQDQPESHEKTRDQQQVGAGTQLRFSESLILSAAEESHPLNIRSSPRAKGRRDCARSRHESCTISSNCCTRPSTRPFLAQYS